MNTGGGGVGGWVGRSTKFQNALNGELSEEGGYVAQRRHPSSSSGFWRPPGNLAEVHGCKEEHGRCRGAARVPRPSGGVCGCLL